MRSARRGCARHAARFAAWCEKRDRERGSRCWRVAAAATCAVLAGTTALAGHNIPRDVSIKYSAEKKRFKGKFKSQVASCRSGIVSLRRVEPGPIPLVGSAQASSDGSSSVKAGAAQPLVRRHSGLSGGGWILPRSVRSKIINP